MDSLRNEPPVQPKTRGDGYLSGIAHIAILVYLQIYSFWGLRFTFWHELARSLIFKCHQDLQPVPPSYELERYFWQSKCKSDESLSDDLFIFYSNKDESHLPCDNRCAKITTNDQYVNVSDQSSSYDNKVLISICWKCFFIF